MYFFQITEENYGATEVLELVPNGDDINVNESNRYHQTVTYGHMLQTLHFRMCFLSSPVGRTLSTHM